MVTKALIGVQAIIRIVLIPVSIVTMVLNVLGIYYMWKFQQTHGQAQAGIGVPRYRSISKDQTGLLQLQSSGVFSLSVAIFSLSSISLMGYLHLEPYSRKGVMVCKARNCANLCLTRVSS